MRLSNYFIEVLPLDVSAYSKKFGVSSDGLIEVEKVKNSVSVGKEKRDVDMQIKFPVSSNFSNLINMYVIIILEAI